MIILPNGKELQKAISKVYFPSTDKSERLADAHLKIEQTDSNLTAITGKGEGGAWFERYLPGSGISGSRFLFRPTRIEDGLSIIGLLKKTEYANSFIGLKQDDEELAVISVQEMDGVEVKREGTRNHFPLYYSSSGGEEQNGFGPPLFLSEPVVAEVDATHFDNLIKDSQSFGGHKYDSFRPVFIRLTNNEIEVLSSCYLQSILLSRVTPAITNEEIIIGFNAAYLEFLGQLGNQQSSISIAKMEDNVTFIGSNGRVTLPILSDERSYNLVNQRLLILNEDMRPVIKEKTGNPLETVGHRVVKLGETHNRFEVQTGYDNQLRVDSKDTNLTVRKLKDTLRKNPDQSVIPIVEDYLGCLESNWISIVLSYDHFLSALSVCKTYLNRIDNLSSDAIGLYQFSLQVEPIIHYFLILEPINQENEKFRLLYECQNADKYLQESEDN